MALPAPKEAKPAEQNVKRLGDLLIERGLLSDEELNRALEESKNQGVLLGKYLVQEGYITEQELVPILTELFGGTIQNEKKKKKLGQILVERGMVTKEQLAKALEIGNKKGLRLGKVLLEEKLVDEVNLAKALSEHFGLEYINLDGVIPSPEATGLVTEKIAQQFGVLPIKIEEKILILATGDPLNVANFDTIKHLLKTQFRVVICPEGQLRSLIQKTYSKTETIQGLVRYLTDKREEQKKVTQLAEKHVAPAPLPASGQVSIESLINMLITDAIKEGASDIHIEPTNEIVRVRVRVDGILRESSPLTLSLHPVITSRIKVLAQLDIAKKREPQDGHFQFQIGAQTVDIRVSTMPITKGEKLVLRILDKSHMKAKLEDIGFDEKDYHRMTGLLHKPHGIILVTGPTGSGKSTTVYSMMNHIKGIDKNLITLEDPVEYEFDLINQVQISEKTGITFAATLRNVLRQDPDIIMVGEIRDKETAEIAIRAALTGHLVISTLHTNGAVSTVSRLMDMGIEPFFVSGSLLGIVAQRLVRKLCIHCRRPHKITEAEAGLVQLPELVAGTSVFEPVGCEKCRGRGYAGREAIFELLVPNADFRLALSKRKSEAELFQILVKDGFKVMRSDGARKVVSGITTLSEVLRVAD